MPEKPDTPKTDPCLIERLEVREETEKLFPVRQEETETLKQINKLKDEIANLRRQQDLETGPTIDRLPGGAGGSKPSGSGGRLSQMIRIGGKTFPYVSAILTAKGIIDSVNRSQMIAAAEQELAALEQKLQSIRLREKAIESDIEAAIRKFRACEAANKRQ